MGLTVTNATADGLLQASVSFPDSGTTVKVDGHIRQNTNEPGVDFTGSTVTIPAAPGSGSIYYIIQVNPITGEPKVKESTSAMPEPDAGWVVLTQQTLTSTTTDPATDQVTTSDEG